VSSDVSFAKKVRREGGKKAKNYSGQEKNLAEPVKRYFVLAAAGVGQILTWVSKELKQA